MPDEVFAVTCFREIIFSLVCTLPRPEAIEPQAFHFGHATNRAEMPLAFVEPLPETGPVIAFRPKQPHQRAEEPTAEGLAVLAAYSPAKATTTLFDGVRSKGAGHLFVLSEGNEKTGCLHKDKRLYTAMQKISRHFGKPLEIESAYRSKAYNDALRRRGVKAAKKSLHIQCRAIDFRIRGVPIRAIARYAATIKEVGGIGTYRTWVHIDTGRRRYW